MHFFSNQSAPPFLPPHPQPIHLALMSGEQPLVDDVVIPFGVQIIGKELVRPRSLLAGIQGKYIFNGDTVPMSEIKKIFGPTPDPKELTLFIQSMNEAPILSRHQGFVVGAVRSAAMVGDRLSVGLRIYGPDQLPDPAQKAHQERVLAEIEADKLARVSMKVAKYPYPMSLPPGITKRAEVIELSLTNNPDLAVGPNIVAHCISPFFFQKFFHDCLFIFFCLFFFVYFFLFVFFVCFFWIFFLFLFLFLFLFSFLFLFLFFPIFHSFPACATGFLLPPKKNRTQDPQFIAGSKK